MISQEQSLKLKSLFRNHPDKFEDFLSCCNDVQWTSKLWNVDLLNRYISLHATKFSDYKIAVLGGWYGLLSHIVMDKLGVHVVKIDSYDIDKKTKPIGDMFNIYKDTLTFHIDNACNINFENRYDIVMNTSSEHMTKETMIHTIESASEGTIFLIQSNNFIEMDDHINCSDSLEEFANRYEKYFNNFETACLPWRSSKGASGYNFDRYLCIGIKK